MQAGWRACSTEPRHSKDTDVVKTRWKVAGCPAPQSMLQTQSGSRACQWPWLLEQTWFGISAPWLATTCCFCAEVPQAIQHTIPGPFMGRPVDWSPNVELRWLKGFSLMGVYEWDLE